MNCFRFTGAPHGILPNTSLDLGSGQVRECKAHNVQPTVHSAHTLHIGYATTSYAMCDLRQLWFRDSAGGRHSGSSCCHANHGLRGRKPWTKLISGFFPLNWNHCVDGIDHGKWQISVRFGIFWSEHPKTLGPHQQDMITYQSTRFINQSLLMGALVGVAGWGLGLLFALYLFSQRLKTWSTVRMAADTKGTKQGGGSSW